MLPNSSIEFFRVLDYFVKHGVRHFLGLFKTVDDSFYLVQCCFDSSPPQVIKDWSTIEKYITSLHKIYMISKCPICFDEIESTEELIVLSCCHCYCKECHQKISECPLCKSKSVDIVAKIPKSLSTVETTSLISVSDLLGYKIVGIVIQQNPLSTVKLLSPSKGEQLTKGIMLNRVSALLSLQIESRDALVYKVEKGSGIASFRKLKRGVKYCTNAVNVISARFIGDEKQIKQSLMCYQTGNARFVSYHDKHTEYPLHKKVIVETAGQGCGNSSCGQGLYFFLDVESTINFWSQRNECVTSENPSTPWMSEPIQLSNGFQAIKLTHTQKLEIEMDNHLTNRNQLEKWCIKNEIKQLNENDTDLVQFI